MRHSVTLLFSSVSTALLNEIKRHLPNPNQALACLRAQESLGQLSSESASSALNYLKSRYEYLSRWEDANRTTLHVDSMAHLTSTAKRVGLAMPKLYAKEQAPEQCHDHDSLNKTTSLKHVQ